MKIKADWEERISFLVNFEESQFEGLMSLSWCLTVKGLES